ncbi:hypothetical protein BJ912DRAFT_499 [Pholiota molesta]|nr:hypothetical protein BJ912DRAFT_499 [Pholiota molesta]
MPPTSSILALPSIAFATHRMPNQTVPETSIRPMHPGSMRDSLTFLDGHWSPRNQNSSTRPLEGASTTCSCSLGSVCFSVFYSWTPWHRGQSSCRLSLTWSAFGRIFRQRAGLLSDTSRRFSGRCTPVRPRNNGVLISQAQFYIVFVVVFSLSESFFRSCAFP